LHKFERQETSVHIVDDDGIHVMMGWISWDSRSADFSAYSER